MAAGAKSARQARSQRTRDALLEAMDALLRERPFEQITIADLAARAGVSPATIYQRFSNKDAAVAILIELYMRKVEDWSRSDAGRVEAASAASLRDALVLIGASAWRQIDAIGHVMRPAYLYSRLRPDLIGPQWAALEKKALEGFTRVLAAFPDETGHRKRSRAASMIAAFFNMMALGRLLHADDADGWDLPKSPRAFGEELADFAWGYLAKPPKAARRGAS